MSRALFRKELREHGLVMLATWVLAGLGFLGAQQDSESGSLGAVKAFARVALPLCAFVAANRLIAREYAGRTLLFLETLPVSRLRVFATKAAVGLVWVATPAVVGCLAAVELASRVETLDGRYVAVVVTRVVVFGASFFSFAVLAATLGRFRWVAWLAALTLSIVLDSSGQVRAQDLPILALADDTLGLERQQFPVNDLLAAGVFGLVALAVAVALIAVGRGAVAMALARRMTAREKVFSGAALLSIIVVSEFAGNFRTRPRYDLKEGVRAKSSRVDVAVATNAQVDTDRAGSLAVVLAEDAEGLMTDLALTRKLPPLFAVPQAGLDADLYVQATLGKEDGVVVQAAFDKPGFDAHDFRAFVVSRMLSQQTRGRAWANDRAWFAWGFGLWWTAQRTGEDTALLALRGLAAGKDFPADGLDAWDRSREAYGECLASGLAFAAVKRLEAAIGGAGVLALAREALAREQHPFFDFWVDRAMSTRLARAGAPSSRELAAALTRASAEEAERPDGLFRRLSRYQASVAPVFESGQLRIEQHFSVAPEGAVTHWRVLTRSLAPWELVVSRFDARRFDLDAASPAPLPLSVPRGDLLFAALEVDDPVLRCSVRPFSQRLELK